MQVADHLIFSTKLLELLGILIFCQDGNKSGSRVGKFFPGKKRPP